MNDLGNQQSVESERSANVVCAPTVNVDMNNTKVTSELDDTSRSDCKNSQKCNLPTNKTVEVAKPGSTSKHQEVDDNDPEITKYVLLSSVLIS